ncbi:MAG: hypothetical protein K9M81_01230 [Chthoniobacterales bacterium]|nr:hypothetical protein [Chthoniobacterales bacterium]
MSFSKYKLFIFFILSGLFYLKALCAIDCNNYVLFLNSTAKSDLRGSFERSIDNKTQEVIVRYGEPGSYFYKVIGQNEGSLSGISWNDAIDYFTWSNALINKKGEGSQIKEKMLVCGRDRELKSCAEEPLWIEEALVIGQIGLDEIPDGVELFECEELFIGLASIFFNNVASHSIHKNFVSHTTETIQETTISCPSRRLFPETPKHDEESSDSSENDLSGIMFDFQKIDIPAESDSSPDSSDSEFGAKTLMRKIAFHVRPVKPRNYAINQDGTEEITEEEIRANPGKFYVANFRGDYLSYFKTNRARRSYVQKAVDSIIFKQPIPYKSKAFEEIEKKHLLENDRVQKFSQLNSSFKLKDSSFIKTYKSPSHFSKAVNECSPDYGNPFISTSKDTKVTPIYADHPKDKASLLPQYSDIKKPKHRLIGMTTVIVHEANEYAERIKADIEQLRTNREIGKMSAIERKNEEILFDGLIESKHIAGYVPLTYPNLSKKYSYKDKNLFGLDDNSRGQVITKSFPRTLGKNTKENTLYKVNRDFQWSLAEKYATDNNPRGELIWVDKEGRFNRFRVNQDPKR